MQARNSSVCSLLNQLEDVFGVQRTCGSLTSGEGGGEGGGGSNLDSALVLEVLRNCFLEVKRSRFF